MSTFPGRLTLMLGVLTACGCQSVGSGPTIPAGPAIISPNGTASTQLMPSGQVLSVSQSSSEQNEASMTTAARPSSPPRILRPASAKPIPLSQSPKLPLHLTSQQTNWSETPARSNPGASTGEPPVLNFENLEAAPPLGSVVSPRTARQSIPPATVPSTSTEVKNEKAAPHAGLVKPLLPQAGEGTRIRRLPPVTKPSQGFLTRPTLPQKPIPIYPELP